MRGGRALVAMALSALAGCAAIPDRDVAPESRDAAVERSRAAADQLFVRLSGELSAAMQAGGPRAAIGVCRDRAPAIAAEIEAETGVDIERTALRVRNPRNAPDAWERQTLTSFERRHAAGEVWNVMEAERIEGGRLRWMRPIPMGPMCAACHGGAEVAPETLAAINAAYPKDAARGFAPGQLRGAFTASTPLGR